MEAQIPVHELATLAPEDLEQKPLLTQVFLNRYREAALRALQSMGFGHISFTEAERSFASRFTRLPAHYPELTAVRNDHPLCISFAPMAETPMALTSLTEDQCLCCDEHMPDTDVYYASLFADAQAGKLYMLGPVQVKREGEWLTRHLEQSQFLPLARREESDRYSPVFGGCVLFKLDRLLIPYVLEHGQLPRFAVQNLFSEQEQGENGIYALMYGTSPTHLMLVRRDDRSRSLIFRRPFFFYGNSPDSELELTRCMEGEDDSGSVELMDKTGHILYAECLESVLLARHFATGRRYKWTLSLVADHFTAVHRELSLTSASLREQAKKDYLRQHGEEPPTDFGMSVSSEALLSCRQEARDAYTELCGKIARVESAEIDGCPMTRYSLQILPQNEDVTVHVFVSDEVRAQASPQPGDMVDCSGFLYASPDEMLSAAESWQDSGEIALLQEKRELEERSIRAFERFSGYSLAQGVVAAACAHARYTLIEPPSAHTRDEATFLVQDAQGAKHLLFVDTQLGEEKAQFHYTQEQMHAISERKKETHGRALSAHHCLVHISPGSEDDTYSIRMSIRPELPDMPAESSITHAVQALPPAAAPLTEAQACRIICNAICLQDWTEFAEVTCEDLAYTSLVNGTETLGKIDYIRYMAERKQLWEKQQGWPGMSMDTGAIEYNGETRPCFMIHCYGRMIGAAVVTIRHGMIATMETVPLEANESYRKDAESSEKPRIFHPMRGHLSPHPAQLTPLQRFAAAYLQECMLRKTGLRAPAEGNDDAFLSTGADAKQQLKGARWLKITRNEPSCCDLAFSHGGKVYAICTAEAETHPDHGGDIRELIERLPEREELLAMAEQRHLIPCIFPAERNYTPDPSQSWNLWDLRTAQPLSPHLDDDKDYPGVSDWEVICMALPELEQHISRLGGRLIAYHDTAELLPHLWFRDAKGRLSWVIVRPYLGSMHADRGISEAEREAVQLTPGVKAYVVDAFAYADPAFTEPARRGDKLRIKLSELMPLDDEEAL